MSDFNSPAFQAAHREYLAIERALRAMGDYVVPTEELRAFLSQQEQRPFGEHATVLPGGKAKTMAFVQRRCVAEFLRVLLADSPDEMRAIFSYSHDPYAPSDSPYEIRGERQLNRTHLEAAYQIAPGDVVIVEAASFEGSIGDLQRVLDKLAESSAMVFVDQSGIPNPMSAEALADWFYQGDRLYVPVKRDLLDSLFRPELPTGPYSFG